MGATSALARASAIALALAALLAVLVPPCAGAGAGGAPPEVLDFLCFGAMVLLLFVTPCVYVEKGGVKKRVDEGGRERKVGSSGRNEGVNRCMNGQRWGHKVMLASGIIDREGT